MYRGSAATRHREAKWGKENFGKEKEEKETEKKEGELQERREWIYKKSVCDECIRLDTNISHIGPKNTVLL